MSEFDAKAKDWDSEPTRKEIAHAVLKGIVGGVPLYNHMSVLEYGCGTGLLGAGLLPHVGKIIFADSSCGMLEVVDAKIKAGRFMNAKTLFLDLEKENPPDDKFDLICASMCLHHVMKVDKVLQAFHSMLVKDGWLCIADLDKEDGSFHGPDFKGHNGFHREEFSRKLLKFGFRDIKYSTIYERKKDVCGVSKAFPIFLVTCRLA